MCIAMNLRMKRLVLGMILTVVGFPVCAQSNSALECHLLKGSNSRLLCYDKATGYDDRRSSEPVVDGMDDGEVSQEIELPSGKQWRLTSKNSALDGRKDVWLSLRSGNTERNSIGSPTYASLWLRCMENSTNVLIAFDSYTSDNQSVRFRLDDGPIQKQWMETIRGGDGLGIWSGSRAIPFVRNMFGKTTLVVAYKTYSSSVEFTFDISGLRERIEPVASECAWSP